MARVPPGIQLGRTRVPALARVLTGASALGLLLAAAGAWDLWRGREELAILGTAAADRQPLDRDPASIARAPAAADGSPDSARSREAATLLVAGAERSARFGRALDVIATAGPRDLRVTGIELRPGGEAGDVEASVAAEAPTSAGIAEFLASLAGMDAVRSTGEIQEARTSAGLMSVRVTVRLASEGRSSSGRASGER